MPGISSSSENYHFSPGEVKCLAKYSFPSFGTALRKAESDVRLLLTVTASRAAWEFVSDRVLTAKFRSRLKNITSVQCYAPAKIFDTVDKDNKYTHLNVEVGFGNTRTCSVIGLGGTVLATVMIIVGSM